MNNNFEVKYTIRLYEPALIAQLANHFERASGKYKHKNEFFGHIIKLGLESLDRQTNESGKGKTTSESNDESPMLTEFYKYVSKQFRKIYLDINVLQRLLCSVYNIAFALNNGTSLFESKIEDGFYDDLPARFSKIIEDLMKAYGLS